MFYHVCIIYIGVFNIDKKIVELPTPFNSRHFEKCVFTPATVIYLY